MTNVLDQLNAVRTCPLCKKRRPLFDFIIGVDENGENLLSSICNPCREEQSEEEIGDKMSSLNIDHHAKRSIQEQKEAEHDEAQEEKEDYLDELDEDNNKKNFNKRDKEHNRYKKKQTRSFLDRKDILIDASKDKTKDWRSRSTEFGFDADIHDPLRQKPNAAHHKLFVTHPDRMDVKFLLEYIISGHYANGAIGHRQSKQIGAVQGVDSAQGNAKAFSKKQINNSKQANTNTNKNTKHAHNADSAKKQLNNKARTLIKQRFKQQQTQQKLAAKQVNPSRFLAGGTRATALHNASKPIGTALAQASTGRQSMFKKTQTKQSPSEGADKAIQFMKKNWGR
jgi:hypothetical protein